MTEVMEREPLMMPTVVRRVHEGGLQVLQRTVESTPEGDVQQALCVYWSVEHARREMYAKGCHPEDGWKAIERDDEELELMFEVLAEIGGPTLAYIEPAPGAPELSAVVDPAEFIDALRRGE